MARDEDSVRPHRSASIEPSKWAWPVRWETAVVVDAGRLSARVGTMGGLVSYSAGDPERLICAMNCGVVATRQHAPICEMH